MIRNLFTIVIVFLGLITFSYSQDQIAYLELDKVINNTKAGKLIINKLEKSKNEALLKFKKKEDDLKKTENEIKKQKNIISEDQFNKKLVEFRNEVRNFRQDRQKVINDFNQKRKVEFEEFFKKITPIIESYLAEKNIEILLDKKNIFVASKNKNITQEIIKMIDSKIK
tara:strand:+ start:17 stop:523 length:507 start_codon:yes stop_codon:yes gene_type:complete